MAKSNGKISLTIPFYNCDPEKEEVLKKCLDSMEGMYDELVIIDQEPRNGIGFVPAVNKCYEEATGDFIIMCCDDVILNEGNLRMLCDKEAVTSAHVLGMPYQDFWGTLWCTPRWIYEKTGPIDEEYAKGLYYDDNEYYEMINKVCKPYTNIRVVVDHPHGGRTLEKEPSRVERMERNKQYFLNKWGFPPHILTENTAKRYGLNLPSMY